MPGEGSPGLGQVQAQPAARGAEEPAGAAPGGEAAVAGNQAGPAAGAPPQEGADGQTTGGWGIRRLSTCLRIFSQPRPDSIYRYPGLKVPTDKHYFMSTHIHITKIRLVSFAVKVQVIVDHNCHFGLNQLVLNDTKDTMKYNTMMRLEL